MFLAILPPLAVSFVLFRNFLRRGDSTREAALHYADQRMAFAPQELAMAAAIRGSHCGAIALDSYSPPSEQIMNTPPGFFVYPLLAQLDVDGQTRSVHYVRVENASSRFAANQFASPACAVICFDCVSSHGTKSDADLGQALTFGPNQLVFPTQQDR